VERPLPQLDGVEHRFAALPGLRVHYAEAGEGDPVLLLHGWPQHHAMWAPVIAGLRDRYRLIAPDLRGFGWTDAPGAEYSGEAFAQDQLALMDALGIERAFVIGHDWGGWAALLIGLEHPERMRSLLVCDTPHPWARRTPKLLRHAWRSWYAACLATPGLGPALLRRTRFAEAVLRRANAGTPFEPAELHLYADSYRDPARARAISSLYRYYFRVFARGLRGRYQSQHLNVPTLVLFGEHDILVTPELVRDPAAYRSHASRMRVELVPDSGHFLVNERPEIVIARARALFGADQ
jgi:pimeloyl-ACP methyl ester carboxylesterase